MEKKDEIIKLLKKEGEMALSRICGILGMNQYYGERYCEELVKEGKLSSRQEGNTKFYKIKEEKKA